MGHKTLYRGIFGLLFLISNSGFTQGISVKIISVVNVKCNGQTTGSAGTQVKGGKAPYTYLWNDPNKQTTAIATNLPAGSYTVTVKDAGKSTASATVTIAQPPALSINSANISTQNCGPCNGVGKAFVNGGKFPYSYQWNDPAKQTTAKASGLCEGTFKVVITDANSCKDSTDVTIGKATTSGMVLNINTQSSTCSKPNGTATVSVSGGTSPFTYLWSDANKQNTATATGLLAGTYKVIVKDANGCKDSTIATVSNTGGPIPTISSSKNVSCNGGSDGTATVSATGGTTPYTYKWNDPLGQTTATAAGLKAGTYMVIVTGAKGCVSSVSTTITEPVLLTTSSSGVNPICNGSCDGSATIKVSGGTTPYKYSWNDPKFQTTATATALCAGAYTVKVTDANGCTGGSIVKLTDPQATTLTTTKVDATCGNSNGSATVVATNGNSPYTYKWNDGQGQTSATASNLKAGSYNVTVTDSKSCTAMATVTVNDIGGPTASISNSTNVSCNGGKNGSAAVLVIGGTGNYTYKWNDANAQTNSIASDLSAGNYSVIVKDGNNCSSSASVVITQPIAINAVAVAEKNVSCTAGKDGKAYVSVSGGTSPYTYKWNDIGAQTTDTASNLPAGKYTVVITDSKSCTFSSDVTITEPSQLTVIPSGTFPSCYGLCDGSIMASVSGGTLNYSYLWNDPSAQSTADAVGLCTGSYTVKVTDGNGCVATANYFFPASDPIPLQITKIDAACGNNNGSATVVNLLGGSPSDTYLWNDPKTQTTATASDLAPGDYMVIVKDIKGCTRSGNVSIINQNGPTVTVNVTGAKCFEGSSGSAVANVSGGSFPYTYLWNDPAGQVTSTANNLKAGTYMVQVTDSRNCIITASGIVTEPAELKVITSNTGSSCANCTDGTATATPSGGTPSYTYLWNDASVQTTSTAMHLSAGPYTVTVTDANGCSVIGMDTVKAQLLTDVLDGLGTNEIKVFPNPTTDNFTIVGSFVDASSKTVTVYNSLGRILYSEVQNSNSMNVLVKTSDWPGGIYTIVINDGSNSETYRISIMR